MKVFTLTALTLAASLMAGGAQAQLMDRKGMTNAAARKAIAATAAECAKNGWNVAIAVVDDAGRLLAFERMDKAQAISVDISQGKARTAALFRRSTALLEEAVKTRPALLSIKNEVLLQGGIPIVVKGEVIGAVGVSGVQAVQDEQCAKAGVAAIEGVDPVP
jgi:glc operon protein GlcG